MNEIHIFIKSLNKAWQRNTCTELLNCINDAAPQLEASIKWGNPYFEHNGAVLKWFVAKDWINVYFFKGSRLYDPSGLFIISSNSKMRTIKLFENTDFDYQSVKLLIVQAIKLNS